MTNTILKALIIDFLQVKYENECEAFQNLCSEFKKKKIKIKIYQNCPHNL